MAKIIAEIIAEIIEFGPCPIYAHGSSFSPNPGIIMVIMVIAEKL